MKSRRGNATVLSGMPPGGANQGACLAVPALQVQTLAVGGGDWERLRAVQAAHDCADAKQGTKAKDKERSSNRARSTTDSFGAPLRSGQSYLVSLAILLIFDDPNTITGEAKLLPELARFLIWSIE